MNYLPKKFEPRVTPLRRSLTWGMGFIGTVLGLSIFKTELDRILSLPRNTTGILYLSLFAATLLLTAGWMAVSHKELNILCEWLDPEEYEPPDGMLVGLAVAAALLTLLFAARSAFWFGLAYSIYTAINVIAVLYLARQLTRAIALSQSKLHQETGETATIYRQALGELHSYYLSKRNLLRVTATLVLAVTGLILSYFARRSATGRLEIYAYSVYLTSIMVLEGALAFLWRARLYAIFNRLNARRITVERRIEDASVSP